MCNTKPKKLYYANCFMTRSNKSTVAPPVHTAEENQ